MDTLTPIITWTAPIVSTLVITWLTAVINRRMDGWTANQQLEHILDCVYSPDHKLD